jgi:predicted dithiol-disulfide oxidoreductase (DUF899 family)
MTDATLAHPPIVSRAEWLAARKVLLIKEKELTRQRDAVNALRRRLPMVRLDKTTHSTARTARRACWTCSTAAVS